MSRVSFASRFVRAVADRNVSKAELRDLRRSAREMPAAKRTPAAGLVDLVRFDRELDADEVPRARSLLKTLGLRATRLASRPACNVAITHLDLELDLRKDRAPATARLMLGAQAKPPLVFEADRERLTIAAVELDGVAVRFVHEHDRLLVHAPSAQGASLRIVYTVKKSKSAAGGGIVHAEGQDIALLWPGKASLLVPSDNRPRAAATASFTLRTAPGTVVTAAGERVRAEGDLTRYELKTPAPLYALGFAASTRYRTTRGRDGMSYVATVERSRAAGRRYLDVARATHRFMTGWFGRSSFNGVREIVETPGALGGMEVAQSVHVTCECMAHFGQGSVTVAHEIVHHWFGDGVRIAHPADFWLSESFTTYLSWRAEEARGGASRWRDLLVEGAEEARAAIDVRRASTPVYPLRPGFNETATELLFDGVSYEYGALLLHALEKELGRPVFDEFLRQWFEKANGRAVDTDEFFALLADKTPVDAKAFRAKWVDRLPSAAELDALLAS
jgi:aminopeptidase N